MKKRLFRLVCLLTLLTAGSVLHSQQDVLELLEPGKRMNGKQVERLQKMLIYYGYDLGKDGADGWFGPATEKALKGYQKKKGLKVTGKIAVSLVQTDLPWEPVISLVKASQAGTPSSKQKSLEIEDGKILKLSNYYGNHTIKSVSDYDERYFEHLLSPSGRFLACRYYNPYAEGGGYSVALFCIDLLTGKSEAIYGGLILKMHTDLKNIDEYSSIIGDFYWNESDQLVFTIDSENDIAKGLFFILDGKK